MNRWNHVAVSLLLAAAILLAGVLAVPAASGKAATGCSSVGCKGGTDFCARILIMSRGKAIAVTCYTKLPTVQN